MTAAREPAKKAPKTDAKTTPTEAVPDPAGTLESVTEDLDALMEEISARLEAENRAELDTLRCKEWVRALRAGTPIDDITAAMRAYVHAA